MIFKGSQINRVYLCGNIYIDAALKSYDDIEYVSFVFITDNTKIELIGDVKRYKDMIAYLKNPQSIFIIGHLKNIEEHHDFPIVEIDMLQLTNVSQK